MSYPQKLLNPAPATNEILPRTEAMDMRFVAGISETHYIHHTPNTSVDPQMPWFEFAKSDDDLGRKAGSHTARFLAEFMKGLNMHLTISIPESPSAKGSNDWTLESVSQGVKSVKCESSISFLDLPAELRNKIYELALIHTDGIQVDLLQYRDPTLYTVRASYTSRRGSAVNMLRANGQIHQEAASIFYGRNVFVFDMVIEANVWLARIGKSIDHVRNITLKHIRYGLPSKIEAEHLENFESWLAAMAGATNLETLTMCLSRPFSPYTSARLAELLLPLSRMLRDRCRKTGEEGDIMRVLRGGPWQGSVRYVDEAKSKLRALMEQEEGLMSKTRSQYHFD